MEAVQRVLDITPVIGCIITDPYDMEFAAKLNIPVMLGDSEIIRARLFDKFSMPVVIVEGGAKLGAVYRDGRQEDMCLS